MGNDKQKKPHIWLLILAWGLIILGIAGIILPILPGWPFVFLGLFIFAEDAVTGKKLLIFSLKKFGQELRNILTQFMKTAEKKPSFEIEKDLKKSGHNLIAGVDEVGRGALAGPLVAAAVVFDIEKKFKGLEKIIDSKKIGQKVREDIEKIIRRAGSIGIGVVEVEEIDKFGIGAANILAFDRALENIDADYILIDGRNFRGFNYKYRCIVRGESESISIAAASIVAKVYRDDLMIKLHKENSIYGFDKHKGYGAKSHIEAIKKNGPSVHHRKSFLRNIDIKNCLF